MFHNRLGFAPFAPASFPVELQGLVYMRGLGFEPRSSGCPGARPAGCPACSELTSPLKGPGRFELPSHGSNPPSSWRDTVARPRLRNVAHHHACAALSYSPICMCEPGVEPRSSDSPCGVPTPLRWAISRLLVDPGQSMCLRLLAEPRSHTQRVRAVTSPFAPTGQLRAFALQPLPVGSTCAKLRP